MFLRKWVRSNSCTGKTARYTKKGSPVDTQYRDVYKEVYSVPHEPIKTLQSAVRMEPTYTGLITGWTRAPSTYLQSRSRGWAIALGFLEASSSWQWARQGCMLWAPLKLLLGWAHTGTGAGHTLGLGLDTHWAGALLSGALPWGRFLCHGINCNEPRDSHGGKSSTRA